MQTHSASSGAEMQFEQVAIHISTPLNVQFYHSLGICPEAEFPGGIKALIAFVNDNLNYPEEAVFQGIEGKVYLRFTVDSEGSLKDVEVVRSIHPLLDAEATRLISIMPNWIPAEELDGKKVSTKVRLPITFMLTDTE